METDSLSLQIWTEGLDEMWFLTPGIANRMQREPMEPADIAEIVQRLKKEADASGGCLFILKGNGRILNLTVGARSIEVSDPNKANYQNVSIKGADLAAFLTGYFSNEHNEKKVDSNGIRILEWTGMVVALIVLGVTVFFITNHMKETSSFIPKPEVEAVSDPAESKKIILRQAGVYATSLATGETIIELKLDGKWGFYDLAKGGPGGFILQTVEKGSYRPVYERQRLAISTDANYLFYPIEGGFLIFQQRSYERIAKSREDCPNLAFPD